MNEKSERPINKKSQLR